MLSKEWAPVRPRPTGTIIRWDRVADFERLREGIDAYIEKIVIRIQHHVGLKLHRFLEKRKIVVSIDVQDVSSGETCRARGRSGSSAGRRGCGAGGA
jgi:hypothetical protein